MDLRLLKEQVLHAMTSSAPEDLRNWYNSCASAIMKEGKWSGALFAHVLALLDCETVLSSKDSKLIVSKRSANPVYQSLSELGMLRP
jgi:hypothetical protein